MKTLTSAIFALLLISLVLPAAGQTRRPRPRKDPTGVRPSAPKEIGRTAVVLDETLSVLRTKPSLFAPAVQRMRRGRQVRILGVAEADGVRFYRVSAMPSSTGWVQADAVFGTFRPADERRLAEFVQAASGFDQAELAAAFFEIFPDSALNPPILLLFGDLLEDTAVKLSRDASNRLDRRKMAATAAPMHSYYLNFVSIDRYRRLGVTFLFNPSTRLFHYDGQSWKRIAARFSTSPEAAEAKKRLMSLEEKMRSGRDKTSAAGN